MVSHNSRGRKNEAAAAATEVSDPALPNLEPPGPMEFVKCDYINEEVFRDCPTIVMLEGPHKHPRFYRVSPMKVAKRSGSAAGNGDLTEKTATVSAISKKRKRVGSVDFLAKRISKNVTFTDHGVSWT